MESFNDEKLLSLCRKVYYTLEKGTFEQANIQILLNKSQLNNSERNVLIEFLEIHRQTKPLSVADMKREIFEAIKYKSGNHYGTICRDELNAIYLHITKREK